MGNTCECVSRQTDDAEDALLAPEFDGDQPRGPPPPYQPRAPLYAYAQMTEEHRIQLVQRLTLIQCLPCGRYADTSLGKESEKKSLTDPDLSLEGQTDSNTTTSSPSSSSTDSGGHGEKKGDKERECPICMLDFVVGQPIRLLPCMHYYHMRCIDDWLMRSLTCPTCMERVDVGVRNTVLSSQSLRRRRVGSSSSTNSTVSTTSSSSMDLLLTGAGRRRGLGHRQGPQLQLRTSSGGQHQQNHNEMLQQGLPQSPIIDSVNQMTLNLEQVNTNTNVEGHPWSSRGGISPPGSPLQAEARGHAGGPPSSPPLIEYHYEFLSIPTSPTMSSNQAHK